MSSAVQALVHGPGPTGGPTLVTLFERQADLHPDRTAVVGEDGELTYRELDEAANALARDLSDSGLAPRRAVLCAFPRCAAAVVAQLAVLKAGAVHVPVDPAAPLDRLRLLATRTAAAALLTAAHRPADSAAPLGGALVPLHRTVGLTDRDPVRPHPRITAADPAYTVFTSGSTGEPKGVVVPHRAIVSTTLARFTHYPETVRRFLLIWQMTFDAAVGCTWWALACGGTLELAPPTLDGVMSAVDAALTGRGRVSHTAMTPSLYHAALQRLPGPAHGAGNIMVAGEPCPEQLLADHYRLQPRTRLWNEYGPTEAAVWCTGLELLPGEEVTVGTAIDGTGILVLDEDGTPVPAGTLGEVHITGDGLADGYLGDPALTAARFPEHPDGRRYRTGDLGRLLPDGRLVVIGRTDHQLKIRGHRVEPGEIEAVLQAHPEVAQAVVTARDGRLVAHVVRRDPTGSGAAPAPLPA
ncbi:amino acid adenylation domain-containing protein [Streptomyces sp. NPDC097619]|uniref:amino acid adenylation domain-containing protein n=1 Tax=Streptomyces sp. NPDC097619 TaxID=3157228 RepID=UPI003325C152